MRLVAESGGQTLSFPLRQGATIVGRHSSCHICIPSRTVSRRHCQLVVDGPRVSVRDLGSSHGTFVNGQRVERAELRDGDRLSLGGFELRFEVTEGVHPYPQGAPADDIVVEGAPRAAGGDDLAGEPPPAPSDFPDVPDEEQTPVDDNFLPQPYTGGQETALGPAMQPQLVVRDGRWYLRDPRTGREVEIAPKGGEAAVAVPEVRRPNVRLLVLAVAVAVAAVGLFAAVFLKKTPPPPGPRYSVADYNSHVDAAIELFEQGKLAEAKQQLALATRKRPDLEAARHVARFISVVEAAKGQIDKLDWEEATRYLESILDTSLTSDRTIAFAKDKLNWLDRERVALGIYSELLRKLKGAGGAEEILVEVYRDLQQLPEGTYAARKAAAETIPLIRKQLHEKYLSRAQSAKKQLRWADAIEYFRKARPYADDPAPLDAEVKDCERLASEAQLFQEAEEAFKSENYTSARSLYSRITGPGFYHAEAQRRLKEIQAILERKAREEQRQQVLELYKRGAGQQAIELLEKANIPDLLYIAERVPRLEKLLADAKKAAEAGRYGDASQLYSQVLDLEPDAENAYHRQAKSSLDALSQRAPEIAAAMARSGYQKITTDPVGARRDFEQALKFDPDNARAKRGLEQLEAAAKLLWNEGCVFEMQGKPANARAKFKRALLYAAPDGELHARIVKKLETLPR